MNKITIRNLKNQIKESIDLGVYKVEQWMEKVIDKIYVLRFRMQQSLVNTEGIGVVEVILILVVLIGLVIIFKSQITSLVNKIFQKITKESSKI